MCSTSPPWKTSTQPGGVSDIVPMQDLFNEWHAKNTIDKVRRIFQMSVSGLGPTQIAKKLRSEGAC